MVLGPAIGGWIGASGDYYFGAKLSVAGSLLSVVLTLFMPYKNNTNNIDIAVKKEIHTDISNNNINKSETIIQTCKSLILHQRSRADLPPKHLVKGGRGGGGGGGVK